MTFNNESRRTIFIVDDEPGFRELLRERLSREGWDVVEAVNIAEVFPLLEETTPDVLVLDHSMPGISGMEAGRILARNNFPAPIVLLSAYLTPELRRECTELGMHAVDKIDGEELVVTCHELFAAAPVPSS
jgi:CheY-like chemotaxis protein